MAWVIDGANDNSVVAAARLMEQRTEGAQSPDKAFELGDGQSFTRGSLVVLPADNGSFDDDPRPRASTQSPLALDLETGLAAASVGNWPRRRRAARSSAAATSRLTRTTDASRLFGPRRRLSTTDYGSIWHTLDQRLGVRHSHLDLDGFRPPDLRRYNVLVLPDRWTGSLPDSSLAALAKWVEAGGTLIAVGRSAAQLASEGSGLSDVRLLRDSQGDLDRYEQAVLREWQAVRKEIPDVGAIWSHTATGSAGFPWSADDDLARPSTEELERRDSWQRQFMPQGAILAARADPEHWLTFGSAESMPLLYGSSRVLMSDGEAPVRIGVFAQTAKDPAGKDPTGKDSPAASAKATDSAVRVGWSLLPAGEELRVRMSGLLWPEAVQRLAHGAAVTRESKGRGQVILFAVPPTFRASTLATERLLMNAIVYGPGLGASTPIEP